jgi:hypothetical protein
VVIAANFKQNFIEYPFSRLHLHIVELLRNISVDFDVTDQLLIKISLYISYWSKEMGIQRDSASAIHRL